MKLLKVFMSTVAVATLTTSCSSLSSFGNGDYYNNYNSYGQQNYQGAAYGRRPVHTKKPPQKTLN